MRNLEDIERDLALAREALSSVEGTPAEVYSRIVGYYRSVRNWNKGKREEYGERRLFRVRDDVLRAAAASPSFAGERSTQERAIETETEASRRGGAWLLLFVRASCPGCIPAKAAAGRLGIPVSLVSTDTTEGMAEAARRGVLSTPTAILLSAEGEELGRARDAETIGGLLETAHSARAEQVHSVPVHIGL
jgi:ribonucleoside-triphosphate reductase